MRILINILPKFYWKLTERFTPPITTPFAVTPSSPSPGTKPSNSGPLTIPPPSAHSRNTLIAFTPPFGIPAMPTFSPPLPAPAPSVSGMSVNMKFSLVSRYDHHTEFAVGVDMSVLVEGIIASTGWDELVYVWQHGTDPRAS